MRTAFFLSAVFILSTPFISQAQADAKVKSASLGIILSRGSKIESKPDVIRKNTSRLDSFAVLKGYNLIKGSAEVFYTDLDSLKQKLTQTQWTIKQEGTSSFYKLQKGNLTFLANFSTNSTAFVPSNETSPLQLSLLLSAIITNEPFGIMTTCTIKRAY